MTPAALEAIALSIPHMGARSIGNSLRTWAAESKNTNIVEAGCWLGAGTAFLALGAMESGSEIHAYDRWHANHSEVEKAQAFGIKLRPGENTLPRVRATLKPFPVRITFHRGSIAGAEWTFGPIGVYVDDASKRAQAFRRAREIFWPSLTDGAVIVLMDYHHYEKWGDAYRAQHDYITGHSDQFTLIEERMAGTAAAAFRYTK